MDYHRVADQYTPMSAADSDGTQSVEDEKDFYHPSKPLTRYVTYLSYSLLVIALWSSSVFVAVKVSSAYYLPKICSSNHLVSGSTSADLIIPSDKLTRLAPKYSCGSTSTEAQSRGCIFDPLMASWIPKECPSYGREEFTRVIKQENLSYYHEDANHKPTLELVDMEQFPHMDNVMYWGTVMEHLTHCAYTLKRIIYTQHTNARFDNVTGNFSHTDHCVEFLISGLRSDPVNLTTELYRTDIPIGFLEC